jgi:purine nucleosidase
MHVRDWMVGVFLLAGYCANTVQAQQPVALPPEKIIIDTDIGDDIDDAFAVALALRSKEFDIVGISTTFGDTLGRARILEHLLGEAGREDVPVAVGVSSTVGAAASPMTQRQFGELGHYSRASHAGAVDFALEQIRRSPGEITLVAIGPLSNIGAMIDKSPDTFRMLKRVVLMGGSIYPARPELKIEWNIKWDIGAAQKLFESGVPLYVMPLDSTFNLSFNEVDRTHLFSKGLLSKGTPLTDALKTLYGEWGYGRTPILYDVMTLAFMLDATLCPVSPMRIRVDDAGVTRVEPGPPNANVCLHSEPATFRRFYVNRMLAR